jgi:hypothetical protein
MKVGRCLMVQTARFNVRYVIIGAGVALRAYSERCTLPADHCRMN